MRRSQNKEEEGSAVGVSEQSSCSVLHQPILQNDGGEQTKALIICLVIFLGNTDLIFEMDHS